MDRKRGRTDGRDATKASLVPESGRHFPAPGEWNAAILSRVDAQECVTFLWGESHPL